MQLSTAVRANTIRLRKLADAAQHGRLRLAVGDGLAAAIEHRHLGVLDVSHVLDIGANRGQFALLIRDLFPHATLDCFEPIPHCADLLERHLDPNVATVHRYAVSDHSGPATFHLSQADDSSSLLGIGDAQVANFPGTGEAGVLDVECVRLDEWADGRDLPRPLLMKIDVQGAEHSVLAGAAAVLDRSDFVYVEVSFVELYDGQVLAPAVIELLARSGFEVAGFFNPQYAADGSAIQTDVLFRRSER